jgi:LytR cell envelope-related transcriptional attenuator
MLAFALGLTLTALSPGRAAADRCLGGTGTQAGPVPSVLTTAVPALMAPRWSGVRYPRFQSKLLGDIDPVYVNGATLWGAFDGRAYWVVPARRCTGDADVVCVLATAGEAVQAATCATPDDVRRGVAVAASIRGERFAIGLAPRGTGRVAFTFDDGGAVVYADRGVFAGSLDVPSRHDGPVRAVDYQPGPQRHYVAPLAVVDQTGRARRSAAFARALQRRGVLAEGVDDRVVDLGAVVAGTRKHTAVLYGAGAKRAARAIAKALHAGAPKAMTGGPKTLLGPVTDVAVLLGRDHARGRTGL